MINILCYGDSNTWGNIAGSRNKDLMLAERFDRHIRWTGVLQNQLGSGFYIIEAGLNGRNTSFDETRFVRPSRNALATFPLIVEMHYPLNLIIIMLGTNDAAIDFKATPRQTNEAIRGMIRYVKKSHLGQNFKAPSVLLIAPAPLLKIDSLDFNLFFNNESIKKTQELSIHYSKIAQEENCAFLDAGKIVQVSNIDGIHLDADNHIKLGHAIAEKIKSLEL